MCLKSLFSTSDFGLKGRASAYQYRTMIGRLNLMALLFMLLSGGMLYLMGFPLIEFFRSMIGSDQETLNGIIDTLRNTEIAIFVIASMVMAYFFIMSIAAMVMRLHDFGRSGFWVAPLLIVPAILDTYLIEEANLTTISWTVTAVALLMLYKNGDFGKNHYGYSEPENTHWPLQLVSFLPITFILIDIALTLFFK